MPVFSGKRVKKQPPSTCLTGEFFHLGCRLFLWPVIMAEFSEKNKKKHYLNIMYMYAVKMVGFFSLSLSNIACRKIFLLHLKTVICRKNGLRKTVIFRSKPKMLSSSQSLFVVSLRWEKKIGAKIQISQKLVRRRRRNKQFYARISWNVRV